MSINAEPPRVIRIFMASPSDVKEERETLASLISEVNDVLAFLAPKQSLRLELMRYETHTYPDIGQAQEVINKQIPQDYDIFVGVMWKRCGTPTASAPSGTVEEFVRALARRERTGQPTIMFYFCDEPFPPPRGEEFQQYAQVMTFREDLESKGYTQSFPNRKLFRDYVRSGLLRAIADLASSGAHPKAVAPDRPRAAVVEPTVDAEILALAAKYDHVRASMPSGGERTRRMSEIQSAMRVRAAAARPFLDALKKSNSAGERLAAISVLQQFPDFNENAWLSDRLNPESETPFVGYISAVALAQAVRSFSLAENEAPTKAKNLMACLENALALAERNPHDPPRIRVIKTAIKELSSKMADSP